MRYFAFLMLLSSLALGQPVNPGNPSGNPMEMFNGFLGAGVCIKFRNGTYEQICSPANGYLNIKNAAGSTVSTLVIQGDTAIQGFYGKQLDSDINAPSMSLHASHVWPFAADAKVPGNVTIAIPTDSKTVVFDPANPDGGLCAGATVTVYVEATGTTLTYGASFCVGGTCGTQAAACASLAAAIDAIAGVGATCSGTTVGVTLDEGTGRVSLAETTAACTTIANGTDGCVKIGKLFLTNEGNTAQAASLGVTCGGRSGELYLQAINGGTGGMYFTNSNIGIVNISTLTGVKYIYLATNKGAQTSRTVKQVTITFPGGGAATATSAGAIPDGAINVSVTGRAIVANTGACASVDIGDGIDQDIYGAARGVALGSTFSLADATATIVNNFTAAGDIVLTGVGGNCATLSYRVDIFYDIATASTAL